MREISKKHWLMSFYKWRDKVKIAKTDGKYTPRKDWDCGYCEDAKKYTEINGLTQEVCDECLISDDICTDEGSYGAYWEWELAAGEYEEELAPALTIFNYTVSEGRRLGYMTPSLEKKYKELTNDNTRED